MANESNSFKLGVGLAHELEMAMNRVGGWDAELVKLLSNGDNLAEVRDLLRINLESESDTPEDWQIHAFASGVRVFGADVRKELSTKPFKFSGTLICDPDGGVGVEYMATRDGKEVLCTAWLHDAWRDQDRKWKTIASFRVADMERVEPTSH